jgi:hypothetical protein
MGTADVAQLAEQLFCKQQVAGSSPIVGSRRHPGLAECESTGPPNMEGWVSG